MFRKSKYIPIAAAALLLLAGPRVASASKVGWMEDVVRRVLRTSDPDFAKAGGRGSARLFDEASDAGLTTLARRSDALARSGRGADEAAGAAAEMRFSRLVGSDPEAMRTFRALEPAERRLVLRMGEAAEDLARRYPERADEMVRALGVEGMTAVRVYGVDVAEVIAREGPSSINVLRRTGREGWAFYTGTVLRHKRKLAAAGVLALFLANPEQFVDNAGKVTEFAVAKFSEAGVDLAGAIGAGAARGLEQSFAAAGPLGGVLKWITVGLAAVVALLAASTLLGFPVGWLVRGVFAPVRLLGRGLRSTVRHS